jgi:hypothetical protein
LLPPLRSSMRNSTWRAAHQRTALTSAIMRLAFAFLLLVVVGCPSRPRPEVEKFSGTARVDSSDFPDARAVILLDRSELTFFPPKGKANVIAEVVHTRRTQIVNEKGLDQAKILIPFDDRSRIVSITSRVIHQDGTIEETHPDAYVDVDRFPDGTPAARLYDAKSYKLTKVKGARVGDVLEVTTLRLVRDPRWLEPIPVGGDLPFARGEVVVNVPKGFDVDFRVTKQGRVVQGIKPTKIPQRIKSLTEKEQDDEGLSGTRFAFIFEREPALFLEGAAPEQSALATQVHVQLLRFQPDRGAEGKGISTVDDVAAWYRELVKGIDKPDKATAELMKGMNKGGKTEKLKSVQRYLQDEIGDVPTFLNLAALPVHAPADIVKTKVGDSKDQAALGLALLRQMNVDGFPVLVSRAGSFASVPDLLTPAPFNHVVIAVPTGGSYAFIDPSTPGLPTGRLPGALQGQKGVVVRPDRGELVDLPEDGPDDNVTSVEVDLDMAKDGTLTGIVKATLQGVDSAIGRQALALGDDAPKILRPLLLGDTAGAPDLLEGLQLVEAFRVAGKDNDPDAPLKLQLRAAPLKPFDDAKPFTVIPERAVGRPLAFLWREGRKAPVVLDHRGVQRVKMSVRMPEGKGIKALPASLQKQGSILKVEEQWAVADGAFWIQRTLRVEERVVPPERYDELRAAAAALWARQQLPVEVVDGGDRGAAYGGDPF